MRNLRGRAWTRGLLPAAALLSCVLLAGIGCGDAGRVGGGPGEAASPIQAGDGPAATPLGSFHVLELQAVSGSEVECPDETATLWCISTEDVPENRPYTSEDLAKAKLFGLVPADEGVRQTLARLCATRKGCWKRVTIWGSWMGDGQTALPCVKVSRLSGTW